VAPTPREEHLHHDDESAASVPTDAAHATPAQVFAIPFMQRALVVGLLVGGVCGFLGVYVVLRRMVFLGVALSQMSSAGVALTLLVGGSPLMGSAGLMLVGVALVSYPWAPRRVRQDAFVGVGYALSSALAVLLLAKSAHGEEHLLNLLFGNILLVGVADVRATALALGTVALFHALFAKEILFTSFDPISASASGYRARTWEALLYLSVGLTIAVAIHAPACCSRSPHW
jgi:zinc transport system permease protein